jgi:aspartate/methionine/tyrosine aminotransferase
VSTDSLFSHDRIDMSVLRRRAYNLRWATLPPDCIALTASEPDFPVASEITDAIRDYVAAGYLNYGSEPGLPEFRNAAANAARERWGLDWGPESILATDSGAAALFTTARFALDPGDDAIVFDPVDFLFGAAVRAARANVVYSPVDPHTGEFDLDAVGSVVTPRTKLLCICNPHNPLGRVMTKDELEAVAAVAVEHDLWILSDHIWSDVVYEPAKHVSVSSLGPEIAKRTITAFGFSKSYGLAGLRIGFLVAHPDVMPELYEASLAPTTAFGAATISQIAATAALERADAWFQAFLAHLRTVRDYSVERLNAMSGVSCINPEATYLLFPDISSFGMTSTEMSDYLLEKGRVAVVPGITRWFGPGSEGHIRIPFATSHEIMRDGLDRIENALHAL